MKLIRTLTHKVINKLSKKDYQGFIDNLENLEVIQKSILSKITGELKSNHPLITKRLSYHDLKKLPITSYTDWQYHIQKQKKSDQIIICDHVKHYQATSGSNSEVKWIPYNTPFIKQLDSTYNTWIHDLYKRYPKIKRGQHYWSMSWIPNDMRGEVKTNDANLFQPFKQFLLNNIFPVPIDVSKADTIEESMYLTAKHLIEADDLSLISVWSPTFFLSILDLILLKKADLIFALKNKKQKETLRSINSLNEMYKLWPNLGLISAWDTASSKFYAEQLKDLFRHVPFQGKGLWATEGVVTIPFQDRYFLAYQSHFYEFEILNSGKIVPSWELKIGDEVSPIITTPNGLIRYKINDRLLVKNISGNCPILNFLGRNDGSDLVGEKLSHQSCSNIIQLFGGFCFVGIVRPKIEKLPYYAFICEEDKNIDKDLIDKELRKNYHYNLARDLVQLGPVKVIKSKNPVILYQELCKQKGMIVGNIKMEVIIDINSDELLL